MIRFPRLRVLCHSGTVALASFVFILTSVTLGPIGAPAAVPQVDSTAEAKTHYQNAVAAISKSDWQTAKSELLQAEKLAPQNALIHYDLALAYSHTGQIKSAQAEIAKAIQLGLPADQKKSAETLRQQLSSQTAKKTNGAAGPSSNSSASSAAVQAPSPAVDGPPLDETFEFLQRMMNQGTVKESGRNGFADSMSYSQEVVISGAPIPCIISWDLVSNTHYAAGTPPTKRGLDFRTDRLRRIYVSLKDLRTSEVKLVDYRTYYLDDNLNHGMVFHYSHDSSNEYSGFVLVLEQAADSDRLAESVPNPSHIQFETYIPRTARTIFFSTQSDGERAEKALIHAATLCGAKAEPF